MYNLLPLGIGQHFTNVLRYFVITVPHTWLVWKGYYLQTVCCFLSTYWVFYVYIFSLFWKENVVRWTTVQRNWRWICLQGRPHPQPNPHLIPLSNSGSSGRSIFHGGTVGRSEAELLPSKQIPRFFPLLSPLKVKRKNTCEGKRGHFFSLTYHKDL